MPAQDFKTKFDFFVGLLGGKFVKERTIFRDALLGRSSNYEPRVVVDEDDDYSDGD